MNMVLQRIIARGIIIFLVGLFFSSPAFSQISGVTADNPLAFGDIFPGIPKKIEKTTPGTAAQFTVSGIPGSEVTIEFTLPTYMSDAGNNMQMIFFSTDCSMDSCCNGSQDQTNPGYTNLDPWDSITYGIGSGGIKIWLGGKVVPKIIQPQGSYTADIVLSITFVE